MHLFRILCHPLQIYETAEPTWAYEQRRTVAEKTAYRVFSAGGVWYTEKGRGTGRKRLRDTLGGRGQGSEETMSNVYRSILWGVIIVVGIVVLAFFIRFLLEVAVVAALLALAYYLFTRATATWRQNRPWR